MASRSSPTAASSRRPRTTPSTRWLHTAGASCGRATSGSRSHRVICLAATSRRRSRHYGHPGDRLQAPRDLRRRGYPDKRPVCLWWCGSVAPSIRGLDLASPARSSWTQRAMGRTPVRTELAQLQRPGVGARPRFRGHRLRSEHRRLSRPQRVPPTAGVPRSRSRRRADGSTTSRSAAARMAGGGADGRKLSGRRPSRERLRGERRRLRPRRAASRTTTATRCSSCRRPCT